MTPSFGRQDPVELVAWLRPCLFGRVEKASVWLVCKLDLRQALTKNGEFRASGAGELRPQKLTKVRGHRIMDSEASLEAGGEQGRESILRGDVKEPTVVPEGSVHSHAHSHNR